MWNMCGSSQETKITRHTDIITSSSLKRTNHFKLLLDNFQNPMKNRLNMYQTDSKSWSQHSTKYLMMKKKKNWMCDHWIVQRISQFDKKYKWWINKTSLKLCYTCTMTIDFHIKNIWIILLGKSKYSQNNPKNEFVYCSEPLFRKLCGNQIISGYYTKPWKWKIVEIWRYDEVSKMTNSSFWLNI